MSKKDNLMPLNITGGDIMIDMQDYSKLLEFIEWLLDKDIIKNEFLIDLIKEKYEKEMEAKK